MSAKQQLEALAENLNEIMSSTAHVKGPEFANAVALHFEALQLAEMVGNMAGLMKSGAKIPPEHVDAMSEVCTNILFSIVMKGINIASDDIKEASDLAERLHKRRQGTMRAISQEMRDQ